MSYIEKMCCLCLKESTAPLSDLCSTNEDGLKRLDKISSCLKRVANAMDSSYSYKICGKCTETVDMIYTFSESCLKNIQILSTYLAQNLEGKKQYTVANSLIIENKEVLFDPKHTNPEAISSANGDPLHHLDDVIRIKLASSKESHPFEHFLIDRKESSKLGESSKQLACREKNYICNVCGKTFPGKKHLTDHLRIHTGSKPFTCGTCYKSFSQKANLRKHLLIHTGEKPHVCDLCNKVFRHKSHLNDHKLIHSGEKPYECTLCNKAFTDKSNLARHKRTHTGERPYTCDICGKSYTQKTTLNKHKIIHESY